jgi:uncharacterized protein YtpQ (UPF0354 family)
VRAVAGDVDCSDRIYFVDTAIPADKKKKEKKERENRIWYLMEAGFSGLGG